MSPRPGTAEARFAAITKELSQNPEVTPPSVGPKAKHGFGSAGLRMHGKIFAMLSNDRLVLKLPAGRVDALVSAGRGNRFDPRHDVRLMKEWLVVPASTDLDGLSLAKEAMDFVGRTR